MIVPARNEAGRVGRCLRGLLDQDYPGPLQIVAVDDASTDGTAEEVERVAAGNPRVRPLRGSPLPAGWAGKPHACRQGADAADADWLCFLDADTRPRPAPLAPPCGPLRWRKSICCRWNRSRSWAVSRSGS